jgi:hypothetical protein
MIAVCWEMSRSTWTYDSVVVFESKTVQYLASGGCQPRVPHITLGVLVASTCKIVDCIGSVS